MFWLAARGPSSPHALADQHFVRNPECIAWVTGQPEIPVVEEAGISKTGSRFYAGSGTIPIQNMVERNGFAVGGGGIA